jgi:hypothetical protein
MKILTLTSSNYNSVFSSLNHKHTDTYLLIYIDYDDLQSFLEGKKIKEEDEKWFILFINVSLDHHLSDCIVQIKRLYDSLKKKKKTFYS